MNEVTLQHLPQDVKPDVITGSIFGMQPPHVVDSKEEGGGRSIRGGKKGRILVFLKNWAKNCRKHQISPKN